MRRWLTEQPYRIANDLKYSPKELKTNVNVTQTSSLKEFFILIAGVLAFLVVGYGALGFLVDLIAPRLPYKIEQTLSVPFEHNIFDVKKIKNPKNWKECLGNYEM